MFWEVFGIVIAVIAAVLLAIFVFLVIMAEKTFGRAKSFDARDALKDKPELNRQVCDGVDFIKSLEHEDVSVTTRDGLTLRGYYIRNEKPSDTTVICVHGYHSDLVDNFSTAVGYLLSLGFNVLLFSQRAHDISDGKYTTFGIKERYDLVDWCNFIVAHDGPDVKIILDGVSMGAATVSLAADRSVGLPSNVKMILADCGYSSPWEEICHVAKTDFKLPKFPFMYMFRFVTKLVCGFDMKGASSVEAVKNTDFPMFFAHGMDDTFVPYEMGVEISSACASDHDFYSAPGAGHGLSFIIRPEEYKERATKFFFEHL